MAGPEPRADARRCRVDITPSATRQLRKLDPPTVRRVQGAIELLALDPRPPASRQLRGRPGYRVRIGDWRVIYTVDDGVLLVLVLRLGHRRDVYEG
ncbi:type II toxin-antitoxin system RelE/ParE family toxin [Nocardioides sp. REDSEA-S30_B4]|uniref:type II toxin-antitoxin system RelE family toxin n=1 Tax=Nocardioides sp. REDSEA-S30_B4 TaxID=1811552 RepID=UPI000AA72117|nr:type II toxin-antitoxin system RelE/ParE family toxin [Nocardioides sp. REDSEA-S30_B4]